ncbi:hypothetical protein ATCC90586_012211 [Pythium insidiosum]|nr:hypothetical protein ATCC90586_012211 [Pythium insidiosum]
MSLSACQRVECGSPGRVLLETLVQRLDVLVREMVVGSTPFKIFMAMRLRVGYQQEKGYCIDIPHDKHSRLQHRATKQALDSSLKNLVRYRTPELRDLNPDILEVALELALIENEISATLQRRVLGLHNTLTRLAVSIARPDVEASHSQTALDRHLTRPVLDLSSCTSREGRHLVAERAHLQGRNATHVCAQQSAPRSERRRDHGCREKRLDLPADGPQMGGKSTCPTNLNLVVLAQHASFVPAAFARVGLIDTLFSRDTATILTLATPRSLVVVDDVGRGTAVHDDVTIAGAVLEALAERSIRTLFAPHFTALSTLLAPQYQVDVQLHRMEVLTRRRQPSDVARNDESAVAQDVSDNRGRKRLAHN